MKKRTMCALLLIFALGLLNLSALDDGLALTPPMGWNSWNHFGTNIDEWKIKEIADAMVSTGMRDAGYLPCHR